MRKSLLLIVFAVLLMKCGSESERPTAWIGTWEATWKTDPTSFEGIEGITDFEMPGIITFDDQMVRIQAYGFPGCAFSVDTLDHSLTWKVRNDSLFLINDSDSPGMIYQIKMTSSKKIELQLMDDIFLMLERS